MARRWVARCDAPGCAALLAAEVGDLEKYEFGQYLNDVDWQAAPGYPETFCPMHHDERYGGDS